MEMVKIRKIFLIATFLALLSKGVLADTGMMGYGMMGSFGMGLYSLLWFALIAFVFSVIFWWTYKWIVKEKKR